MNTADKLPLSILILAGGRGSRMGGRDKGLVELQRLPFVEHTLKIAAPYSDDIIISCNRNLPLYRRYSDRLVQDPHNDYPGPLAGIQAGLRRARQRALLVLPCDTPLLPADLPRRLYQAFLQHPDAISLVHDGERRQPLHAIIPTALLADLEQFMGGEERGVLRWYQRHPVFEVLFEGQAGLFANINRPEELEAIDAQLR